MNKHVMIDLETMSTAPNAAIVQIGVEFFDPLGPILYTSPSGRCWNVDLRSCQKAGLHIDGDTVVWWLQQPKEAQDALLSPDPLPVSLALHELATLSDGHGFVVQWDEYCVWSHGATFDCVILDQAYRAVGKRTPWHFRNVRDTRTLFDLVDPNQEIALEDVGPRHHALWDAWRQAVKMQKCYRLFNMWRTQSIEHDLHEIKMGVPESPICYCGLPTPGTPQDYDSFCKVCGGSLYSRFGGSHADNSFNP
mgnify:CR=1 FL=1